MAKINKYWGYVAIGALTAAAAGAVAALIAKKGSCKEDFDFEKTCICRFGAIGYDILPASYNSYRCRGERYATGGFHGKTASTPGNYN